ncbi:MAG: hypothetical protein AAF938_13935 [Myxococcota bacterium]
MARYLILLLVLSHVGCGDDDGGGDASPMDGAMDAMADQAVVDEGMQDEGMEAAPEDVAMDEAMPCGDECNAESVSVGANFACTVQVNGEAFCWGGNLFGQLGDDRMVHGTCGMTGTERLDCSDVPQQVRLDAASGVEASGIAACGLLEADGNVLCWGLADTPNLGTDSRERRFRPQPSGFENVSLLRRGGRNICAVGAEGVLCNGENDSGQVGDGTREQERREPVLVAGTAGASLLEVSRGGEFACALVDETTLCWGDNRAGQLGNGIEVHEMCGLGIDIYDCSPVPVEAELTGVASALALGTNHACALIGTDVFCWGANSAGQLGRGEFTGVEAEPALVPGVAATAIAAAANTTCALLTDGSIQCWGANDEGQLGDGLAVGDHETCTVGSETVDCIASPVAVSGERTYTALGLGVDNGCAVSEGEVWCWGSGDQNQLGPNGPDGRARSTEPVLVPRER